MYTLYTDRSVMQANAYVAELYLRAQQINSIEKSKVEFFKKKLKEAEAEKD